MVPKSLEKQENKQKNPTEAGNFDMHVKYKISFYRTQNPEIES